MTRIPLPTQAAATSREAEPALSYTGCDLAASVHAGHGMATANAGRRAIANAAAIATLLSA
jgi:hypothetical protein